MPGRMSWKRAMAITRKQYPDYPLERRKAIAASIVRGAEGNPHKIVSYKTIVVAQDYRLPDWEKGELFLVERKRKGWIELRCITYDPWTMKYTPNMGKFGPRGGKNPLIVTPPMFEAHFKPHGTLSERGKISPLTEGEDNPGTAKVALAFGLLFAALGLAYLAHQRVEKKAVEPRTEPRPPRVQRPKETFGVYPGSVQPPVKLPEPTEIKPVAAVAMPKEFSTTARLFARFHQYDPAQAVVKGGHPFAANAHADFKVVLPEGTRIASLSYTWPDFPSDEFRLVVWASNSAEGWGEREGHFKWVKTVFMYKDYGKLLPGRSKVIEFLKSDGGPIYLWVTLVGPLQAPNEWIIGHNVKIGTLKIKVSGSGMGVF